MRAKTVVMCVCHRRTFAELKAIAEERNLTTLDEVVQEGWCGGNCAMCHPYVRRMLECGETEFAPGDVYRMGS